MAEEIQPFWYSSLTKKGGRRWESLFRPQWNKYISYTLEYKQTNNEYFDYKVSIESLERRYLDDVLLFLDEEQILDAHIVQLQIWHPVYWKSFSRGFCLTFVANEEYLDSIELGLYLYKLRSSWVKVISYSVRHSKLDRMSARRVRKKTPCNLRVKDIFPNVCL